MRRVLSGTLMLLLLTPLIRAQDDAKDKPPPDKPATPAEQYQALAKEFDKAQQDFFKVYQEAKTEEEKAKVAKDYPQPTKFTARFLELATKYPQDPAAVDALVWIVTRAALSPDANKALEMLQKDHLSSPKMAEVCQALTYVNTPLTDKLLHAVLDSSKNHAAQGQACYVLAQHDKQAAERARDPKDAAEYSKKAEALFGRVEREFADVKSYRGTLGDSVKGDLFEIRSLAIGKVAPDVEGQDIDGKSFKLSEYRGKVVVLDFWGHW